MMPEEMGEVEETVDMDSTGDQDPARQYELSQWENRILDVIMDSMRMSALSVALQCLSSILLGRVLKISKLRRSTVGNDGVYFVMLPWKHDLRKHWNGPHTQSCFHQLCQLPMLSSLCGMPS